jgi:hypothetical protein
MTKTLSTKTRAPRKDKGVKRDRKVAKPAVEIAVSVQGDAQHDAHVAAFHQDHADRWEAARLASVDADEASLSEPVCPEGLTQEQLDAADAEEAIFRSIVKGSYKAKYRARGNARGCGDWLHVTLAGETLDEAGKLIVSAFEAILDANGVKHSHWNRTTPGWQGRLRMTGRLALQTVVAKTGQLRCADGEVLDAPEAWVARIAR